MGWKEGRGGGEEGCQVALHVAVDAGKGEVLSSWRVLQQLGGRSNSCFDIYGLIKKKKITNTDAAKRPRRGHMLVCHTGGPRARYERR